MKALAVLAVAAVSMAGADRHEGFYRFTDAPAQHCIEQVRRAEAKPKKADKLGDLPAAYAIRLKDDAKASANGCFRLKRQR